MEAPDELVSVIVPAHNEAKVIGRLAQSILEQRYSNLELIVVLDRCTDATQEILEVVARYVEIDVQEGDVSVETEDRVTALVANLPIRRTIGSSS